MVDKDKHKKEKTTGNEVISDGYVEKLVCVHRVTKVVKGGRIFSFRVSVVVGGKGRVGFGQGKAREVPAAIKKAMENARRNMKEIHLKDGTLQHAIKVRFGSARVFMWPADKGRGIIAGGAMRPVFEVLGVKDISAKCVGSSSKINIVKATIKGLAEMSTPQAVAKKRGLPIKKIIEG